jgi:CRISPR-associated protein Cmr4
MPTQAIDLYLITTLSNLHAGRGDSNYGIVDNEVQRDPITNHPVIFASSLKGALRERFDQISKEDATWKAKTIEIFGNEVRNNGTIQAGKFIFHEARLLSLPVRGSDRPFYHAVCPSIYADLKENLDLASADYAWKQALATIKNHAFSPTAGAQTTSIDEFNAQAFDPTGSGYNQLSDSILPKPYVVFPDAEFGQLCERLPVIARNQLEDRVSKNLFYEEVVPRQTRFTFFVERPVGNNDFEDAIKNHFGNKIQIGANASIGYGLCKIEKLSFQNQPQATHESDR